MKESIRTYEKREYPKLQKALKHDPFKEDVLLLIDKCVKLIKLHSGVCDEEIEFERAVERVRKYFKED